MTTVGVTPLAIYGQALNCVDRHCSHTQVY